MTRPGTEPRSPGPLVNTLPSRPMSRFVHTYIQFFVVILRNVTNRLNLQVMHRNYKEGASGGVMVSKLG